MLIKALTLSNILACIHKTPTPVNCDKLSSATSSSVHPAAASRPDSAPASPQSWPPSSPRRSPRPSHERWPRAGVSPSAALPLLGTSRPHSGCSPPSPARAVSRECRSRWRAATPRGSRRPAGPMRSPRPARCRDSRPPSLSPRRGAASPSSALRTGPPPARDCRLGTGTRSRTSPWSTPAARQCCRSKGPTGGSIRRSLRRGRCLPSPRCKPPLTWRSHAKCRLR
mmetsp:Transcript_53650/g.138744  ORF Transcript_53650/g.138744 Transcript_53650/m.138744 type:complete len:226 (+) Transcript_53650:2-679(+)